MKKIIITIFILLSISLFAMAITDTTYLLNGLKVIYLRGQTDVGIYDYKAQSTTQIKANPQDEWELHEKFNQIQLSDSILKFHNELQSTAFLIIKDGKILIEKYFNDGGKKIPTGVWSITKTYTSLLVLKAIEDGLIDNIDDPVKKYVPNWKVKQDSMLKLRHLASMSTGLFWDEGDHDPFSLIAKLNFYGDLEKYTINDLYAVGNPGQTQHYNSGGTQLLGNVLNNVLKDKSISEYLSEKFWQPLGCQDNALFILDSEKHKNEKTFGGLVANARDISRLGQLIINDGVWNGTKILDSTQLDYIKSVPYNNKTYSYGYWTGLFNGKRFYYQSGFKGQFCISFPEYNLVITRFGHKALKKSHMEDVSKDIFIYIKEALRIIEKINA